MYSTVVNQGALGGGFKIKNSSTGATVVLLGLHHTNIPHDPIFSAYRKLLQDASFSSRPVIATLEAAPRAGIYAWDFVKATQHGGEMQGFAILASKANVDYTRLDPSKQLQLEHLVAQYGEELTHYLFIGRDLLQFMNSENMTHFQSSKDLENLIQYLSILKTNSWSEVKDLSWYSMKRFSLIHQKLFREKLDLSKADTFDNIHKVCNWSQRTGPLSNITIDLNKFRDQYIANSIQALLDEKNILASYGIVHLVPIAKDLWRNLSKESNDWKIEEISLQQQTDGSFNFIETGKQPAFIGQTNLLSLSIA